MASNRPPTQYRVREIVRLLAHLADDTPREEITDDSLHLFLVDRGLASLRIERHDGYDDHVYAISDAGRVFLANNKEAWGDN